MTNEQSAIARLLADLARADAEGTPVEVNREDVREVMALAATGAASQIVNALVDANAKNDTLNKVREQMADEIAHLNGLLDWAYDGLDEHWAALPENAKRMKMLADLFERKHK